MESQNAIATDACYLCGKVKPTTEFPYVHDRKNGVYKRRRRCSECTKNVQTDMRRARKAEWDDAKASGTLDVAERWCSGCKTTKTLRHFGPTDTWCRKCNRKRAREASTTPRMQYTQAKGIAKKRRIPFTLTFDEYTTLRANPCTYCGGTLNPTGMGLDRVNNDHTIGYTVDNVVPCCWECNDIKADRYSFDDMLWFGALVRHRRLLREANGDEPVTHRRHGKRMQDD